MSRETQASISAWQLATFPNATEAGVVKHLTEEFHEFLDVAHTYSVRRELRALDEAADIVILLYAWAATHNYDLHEAIDAKMAVNRTRTWNIQPDGTGRHV